MSELANMDDINKENYYNSLKSNEDMSKIIIRNEDLTAEVTNLTGKVTNLSGEVTSLTTKNADISARLAAYERTFGKLPDA
jgi:predicted  nucleic acid-binding Zn-ribbon protein